MVTDDTALEGAFKTPGLRGVADRPPYMHAGQFATLERPDPALEPDVLMLSATQPLEMLCAAVVAAPISADGVRP